MASDTYIVPQPHPGVCCRQGVLAAVVPQLRQVFERVSVTAGGGSDGSGGGARTPADVRFEHFRAAVWPRMQSSGASGAFPFLP